MGKLSSTSTRLEVFPLVVINQIDAIPIVQRSLALILRLMARIKIRSIQDSFHLWISLVVEISPKAHAHFAELQ